MKIKSRIQKRRIILTFLLSYILILFIPLFIGSLVYNEALGIIEESVTESNLSMLEQTKDIMDSRLSEIEKISYQLSLNPRTAIFFDKTKAFDNNAYYDITEYIPLLKNYWMTNNDFVVDFYIYFKNMNTIVSSETFYDMSRFYGDFFTYNGWKFEEFNQNILNKVHNMHYLPAAPMTTKASWNTRRKTDVVAYLQSIPIGYPNEINGTIMVLINNQKIMKLLQRVNIEDEGWVYIADKQGNIITSISKGQNDIKTYSSHITNSQGYKEVITPEGNMMVTYTTSTRNGWKYVSVLPSSIVMLKVNYIKRITWIFVLTALAIGVFIAYIMAYRNTKPIKKTVMLLKEFLGSEIEENCSEYSFLQNGIGKIINTNLNLQDAMEKQIPVLKMAFLNRLFRGDYNNMEEVEAAASSLKAKIEGKKFAVIVFRIKGYGESTNREILNELNMKRVIVKNVLSSQMQQTYLYDVEENKIAWLYASDTEDERNFTENVEKSIRIIYDKIYSDYGIDLSFAVGGNYDSLLDTWRSFNEANQITEYSYFESDCTIIWHSKLPGNSERYSYSTDVELKLMNFIRGGDKDNMKKLVEDLYRINFKERSLSRQMKQRLVFDMSGTLIKLTEQINAGDNTDNVIRQLDRCATIDETYGCIIKGFDSLCDAVNNQKKSHNTYLRDKIIEYVEKNYMDSELCLCSIATKVNLSETYLSQFFKEQTGENFATYLERMRIHEACSLLIGSDRPINDIAAAVGYNSDHVFRRAFKRVTALSPSEYKNNMLYTK